MCLLVVHEPGFRLATEQISNAWENNPDGSGFMHFVQDDAGAWQVKTFKTMSYEAFLDAYEAALNLHPDSPFVVHFRYATSGITDTTNVHPFRVTDATYMAHNGVLPIAEYKEAGWSDTQTFANHWLAELDDNWLDNDVIVALTEEFISGSKLAFLTVEPALTDSWVNDGPGYYILNEQDGHWGAKEDGQDGVWFSNYSYEYVRSWVRVASKPKAIGTGTRMTSGAAVPASDWTDEDAALAEAMAINATLSYGERQLAAYRALNDERAQLIRTAEEAAATFDAEQAAKADVTDGDPCPWCGTDIKHNDCFNCMWCYDCDASYHTEDPMNNCVCRRAYEGEDRALALVTDTAVEEW